MSMYDWDIIEFRFLNLGGKRNIESLFRGKRGERELYKLWIGRVL